MIGAAPRSILFPYTTLFRSSDGDHLSRSVGAIGSGCQAATFLLLRLGPKSRNRSEEHTFELQSHSDLVCRLLLEKKKKMHRRVDRHTGAEQRRGCARVDVGG